MQEGIKCDIILVMKNKRINIPNILTLIRLFLVPVFWLLFFNTSVWWAMAIFILASLTDVLDGYIARKYDMITSIGKVMDPFADKLMQISVMLCVVIHGALHWIFAVLILIKESYMITCSFLLLKKKVVVYSNIFGKLATVAVFVGFFIVFIGIGMQATGSDWQTVNLVGTVVVAIAMVCSWFAAVIYSAKIIKQIKGKNLNEEQIDIKF